MKTRWEGVIGLVYLSSCLIFGLLGGVFLFVPLTNPTERYWNNVFRATLPGWQWSILMISTLVPVIVAPVYAAIKKKDAFPLFLRGILAVFLGSLIYVCLNLPFK
jgi:hypothetical protein